ncbi:hypothetical protein C0989_008181 [Termitomyces sp. Mn162]|nr:hypothetical protein C0989_008181 [Termitomyces sp. Mn162]
MLSSDSSSSSDREPTPPPKKLKDKGKKKSVAIPTDGKGKNEGPDPNWDYKPPPGVTLLQDVGDAGEFDWDAVANDNDTELWLIRVPESIKPKYLENMTLETLKSTKKSSRMATLKRTHATFDIWSVGEDDDANIGGEEVKALSCLLPRKTKNGKLYPAPKPIARHLVVSAQAVAPTPDPASTSPAQIQPYTRPPRENYPKDVLTHSFQPYGSLSGKSEDKNKMDVDVPAVVSSSPTLQKKAIRGRVKVKETEKKEKTKDGEDKMDVDGPLSQAAAAPSSSPAQKKAKRAKEVAVEVDKKAKGRKRKGEGAEASSEKKLKKAKTS